MEKNAGYNLTWAAAEESVCVTHNEKLVLEQYIYFLLEKVKHLKLLITY